MARLTRGWVITATFLIAFMLTAMPLPAWAAPWRPAWVALALIYWCLTSETVGLVLAWCLGLLMDVLVSAPLGQNVLGLTLIAFLTLANQQRIRVFPVGQQAIIVGLLVLLYQLLGYLVRLWTQQAPDPVTHWFPALTSMVLWPWLFIVLRDIRHRAQPN